MEWPLDKVALVWGAVMVVIGAWGLVSAASLRRAVQAFPRHRVLGWVLAAAALAWSGLLVRDLPLGPFDRIKPSLVFIVPVLVFLVIRYMPELLAPRALGGLLLLLGTPILEGIRWHDSGLRLVVAALTYAVIVFGMILVLSPFRFRQWIGPVVEGGRVRLFSGTCLLLGGLLAWIGLAV